MVLSRRGGRVIEEVQVWKQQRAHTLAPACRVLATSGRAHFREGHAWVFSPSEAQVLATDGVVVLSLASMLALTSGRNRDATLERCGALHGRMQTLDSQLRFDRSECERAGDRAHQAEKSVKELREELHKLGEKKAQLDAQVQSLRNDITASTQLNQCVALGAFSTPVVFGITSDEEDDATLEVQRRAKLAESIIKLADATREKILERKDEKVTPHPPLHPLPTTWRRRLTNHATPLADMQGNPHQATPRRAILAHDLCE